MSDQRGFTLLELVVAGGLAAGLFTIIWLVQPLQSRLALRAAAATLVGDVRLVQARAIAEREPDRRHGIEFRPVESRYLLFVRQGPSTTVVREQRLPPRVRLTYARFGGGAPTMVFFTGVSLFGAPSGGGTVTLSSGSARLCVRLLPATGRVRVANTGCP